MYKLAVKQGSCSKGERIHFPLEPSTLNKLEIKTCTCFSSVWVYVYMCTCLRVRLMAASTCVDGEAKYQRWIKQRQKQKMYFAERGRRGESVGAKEESKELEWRSQYSSLHALQSWNNELVETGLTWLLTNNEQKCFMFSLGSAGFLLSLYYLIMSWINSYVFGI